MDNCDRGRTASDRPPGVRRAQTPDLGGGGGDQAHTGVGWAEANRGGQSEKGLNFNYRFSTVCLYPLGYDFNSFNMVTSVVERTRNIMKVLAYLLLPRSIFCSAYLYSGRPP